VPASLLIDIHTHQPTGNVHVLEVQNLYFGEAKNAAARLFSAGLHPWFVTPDNLPHAIDWLEKTVRQPEVIAVGEAGLDKATPTDWALQWQAFEVCVNLSETVAKPLLLHCVRAFSEIIAFKKRAKPQQPWIFHGFDKNWQTATMLLQNGCFLSFGKALFNPDGRTAAVLANMPADRFFLETDNSGTLLADVYARAAAIRGCSPEILAAQQQALFQTVFNVKTADF
jgi:TatD DNase family protein